MVGLIGKFKLKVITDPSVDRKFGTGVVKVTPAHDPNDFEIGKRHGLEIKQVIKDSATRVSPTISTTGLTVRKAREKIVADLKDKGLIEKIDYNYNHAVATCYKCGHDLEPTIYPNWFIKVAKLKKPVIEAVKQEKVKFYPQKFKKQMLQWLEQMHDWPISRQIVWGIRIPIWYDVTKNPDLQVVFLNQAKQSTKGKISELLKKYPFIEIESGLQELIAPIGVSYQVSESKPAGDYLQETDTFDTWFSSGQWPLVTLKKNEEKTRFPTDFMGTLADILKFWISRMMMLSLYLKNEIPFKDVYLWSMVADAQGVKMSKSKGNVIDPLVLVNQYGADAFRASLLFGVGQGGKVNLSEDKVRAMRNFANKIWNIGRFIQMNKSATKKGKGKRQNNKAKLKTVNELKKEYKELEKKYHQDMQQYKFSQVFGEVYEFVWHRFADYYLEVLKDEVRDGNIDVVKVLENIYIESLRLLHPFMPFITEAAYQQFKGEQASLLKVKS